MRSLTEALLYPGVGWLEATNLATGRGTDTPFERVGAPWIEPSGFAAALNAAGVPGARFVPIWFIPSERQYKGERCGGVQILITDWSSFDPLRLGLALAVTLREALSPGVEAGRSSPDAGGPGVLRGHRESAVGFKKIEALWQKELEEFRRVRARYLLV